MLQATETRKLRVLILTSEWHGVPFLQRQVEHLRRLPDLDLDVFRFRGGGRPVRYLSAWWRLRRQVDLRDFDLVHAHFGQSGLVALPCPRPLVVTFHGSDLQGFVDARLRPTLSGRLLRHASRFVARWADQRILVGAHLASQLPQGLDYDVIPCGVDLERFQPGPSEASRRRLGLPLDRCLVLFGGRPSVPLKRVELARRTVAQLAVEFEPAPELVVMDDVPHEQVPDYLRACDVMLLTSLQEGSPTIVKESLACRVPVVSVDVGDVRERLRGLASCAICDDDSPVAIGAALRRVLTRSKTADDAMLQAARDVGDAEIARRLLRVYRRTCGIDASA